MGGNALGGPDPVFRPCVQAGGGGGPVPREQELKLRGRRGAPGAPRLVLGRAGRRRQGGVREGVTASPHSRRFCSAPFLLVPTEGKVRACKPSGRRNQADSMYSSVPSRR